MASKTTRGELSGILAAIDSGLAAADHDAAARRHERAANRATGQERVDRLAARDRDKAAADKLRTRR